MTSASLGRSPGPCRRAGGRNRPRKPSSVSRAWLRLTCCSRSRLSPPGPDLPRAAMRRIATIGVYGFTAGAFLDKLACGDVGLLLDLHQRRGVRGPAYSWANSARLQRALAAADIGYRHVKELAPTTELRQLQYREDDRLGVGKRNRIALAPEYAERYTREILDA